MTPSSNTPQPDTRPIRSMSRITYSLCCDAATPIYINEPHPSGGAVVASFPVGHSEEMIFYLNDLLGTTLASVRDGATHYAKLSAFGQQLSAPSTPPQPTVIAPTADPATSLPESIKPAN